MIKYCFEITAALKAITHVTHTDPIPGVIKACNALTHLLPRDNEIWKIFERNWP